MRKQTEKPKVSPTMCKRKEELCGLLFAIDSLRKLVIFTDILEEIFFTILLERIPAEIVVCSVVFSI